MGGSEAYFGEFPFQISLRRFGAAGWSHICGGSIFNEKTILNAAHCVSGYIIGLYRYFTFHLHFWLIKRTHVSNLQVVAGEYNINAYDVTEQIRNVASYEIHPSYDSTTFEHDISLIKVIHLKIPFLL